MPVQDIFATGRDYQVFAEYVRFRFWTEQPVEVGCASILERQLVAKIILPKAMWLRIRNEFRFPAPANVG
jgi:hypothetical protein